MAAEEMTGTASAHLVRSRLAAADRRRRVRDAAASAWSAAPIAAFVCVCLAALTRWRGWPAALPAGALVAAALALFVRAWVARRMHPVSDRVAAQLDRAAGLEGELRSAGWFATGASRDEWTEFHLRRAANRLEAEDWQSVYPATPAWAAKTATAAFAIVTLALVFAMPGRGTVLPGAATLAASHAAVARTKGSISAETLLPELQKELLALLAAAETSNSTIPAGTPMTATDLRKFINKLNALRDAGKLNDLARAMSPAAAPSEPSKEMKALADRTAKAAASPAIPQEARDTLQQVADEMADAAKAALPPAAKAGEAETASAARKSDPSREKKGGDMDDASIESMSEAAAGAGGAGVMMMDDQGDEAAGRMAPGLGLGGGSDARTDGGRMANLDAALRREIVEASTDTAGENIQTDTHRKTEHGQASVAYAGGAAAVFDQGRAVAPPPVPENRRTAVQTYFIRKQ